MQVWGGGLQRGACTTWPDVISDLRRISCGPPWTRRFSGADTSLARSEEPQILTPEGFPRRDVSICVCVCVCALEGTHIDWFKGNMGN